MGWIFLLLGISVSLFVIRDNAKRAQKKREYALKANCLLTRHPLIFVSGKRSIFYSRQYWGLVPSFLAQHGYEALELDLPWRNQAQREASLIAFLEEQDRMGKKYHLFLDESSLGIAQNIFSRNFFDSIASCTMVAHGHIDFGAKTLKPLKHSIEAIPTRVRGKNWIWYFHNMWTGQKLPDLRRQFDVPSTPNDFSHFLLSRAVVLAEKDFSESIEDAPLGEPHHEQPADRPQGDFFRLAELS